MPRHKLVIDFSTEIGGMFCKYCRVFKPMDAFSPCEIKTWRSAECSACRSERGKVTTPEQREERNRRGRELREKLKQREHEEETVQVCSYCGFSALSRHFVRDKARPTGHNNVCIPCANERTRKYKRANRLKVRAQAKEYYERNKPRIFEYMRKLRNSTPERRLISAVRSSINRCIRKGHKCAHSLEMLGVSSIEEYKRYLEDRFELGMSWKNYGNGVDRWNIDHVKELFKFDLTKPSEQRRAFHHTNTRPMWQTENASNGNRAWCASQGKEGY